MTNSSEAVNAFKLQVLQPCDSYGQICQGHPDCNVCLGPPIANRNAPNFLFAEALLHLEQQLRASARAKRQPAAMTFGQAHNQGPRMSLPHVQLSNLVPQ